MQNTADFLDALRVKFDLPSDYAAGKLLGMHRQQVSRYRNRQGSFDDGVSLKIAELLALDPGYVMACMHAQRSKLAPVRKAWERTARLLASTAAGILVFACALVLAPDSLSPVASANAAKSVYYVKSGALLFALIVTAYLLLSAAHPNNKNKGE